MQRLTSAISEAGAAIYEMTPAARRAAEVAAKAKRRADAEAAAEAQRQRDEAEKAARDALQRETIQLFARLQRDTKARGEPLIQITEQLPDPYGDPNKWEVTVSLVALTRSERDEYNQLAGRNPELVRKLLDTFAAELKNVVVEEAWKAQYVSQADISSPREASLHGQTRQALTPSSAKAASQSRPKTAQPEQDSQSSNSPTVTPNDRGSSQSEDDLQPTWPRRPPRGPEIGD
jgi:hypothetical protein